jgi:hypothetical protein
MPIDNELEIDQLGRPMIQRIDGIGFNPFEDRVGAVAGGGSTFAIDSWATITSSGTATQSISNARDLLQRFVIEQYSPPIKKPKQKPLTKLLDEVAVANKDIFDCVNKVQEEINTLEKTKLIELAETYDTFLFLIIGKKYTLKNASEKSKLGYYNTLTQQLLHTIHGVAGGTEINLEDFKQVMSRHVSRFVELDNVILVKYNKLFEELHDYYRLMDSKKKEKRKLMGRESKIVTVCEDYINGNSNNRDTIRLVVDEY